MADETEKAGLIGGLEQREIVIADYDPAWRETFDVHARLICDALGDELLRLEHIGSTSVPGLAAKPIIDILLVVADSSDEPRYLPGLLAAGYELRVREPEFHEHRMLRTPRRDVHVHVYSEGCLEIERYLALRDHLRQSPDDRRLYEATKRQLAAQSWSDMNA